MAKKQKEIPKPPSKAYLVSFGDTMTTLLAFFIVLCSLAEDQSGANVHSGTGSFVNAMDTFGLPGMFSGEGSANAIDRSQSNPLYLASESEEFERERNPSGPDGSDDGMRVIDREADQLQRFLNEVERLASVETLPTTKGAVVFDFFDKLDPNPPHLPANFKQIYRQIVPALQNNTFRVEIVVWATTPSPSAWQRATKRAAVIAGYTAEATRLDVGQRERLHSFGRPWQHKDERRPTFSIVVRKVAPANG